MKLLTTQKNSLYEIIENYEMSPSSFEIQEYKSPKSGKVTTKIVYKESEFFFALNEDVREILNQHSPGASSYFEMHLIPATDINRNFGSWLRYLAREINEVNKWDRLKEEINQINIVNTNDGDKFSAAEYEELKAKLIVLKDEIKSLPLLPEQIQIIKDKIDHLSELAITSSKFDWKSLFIGTIVSIIIQLSISQENGKALWDIIKRIFNQYFLP